MVQLRTGIDMIEIERFETALRRHGVRFLERVFTPQELAEVGKNTASLAARFAAKEAAAKALGTGIGLITWQEIEILRGPAREPTLCLHGAAGRLAQTLHLGSLVNQPEPYKNPCRSHRGRPGKRSGLAGAKS
jgi:holo-[acyl-carrier protein] synthase